MARISPFLDLPREIRDIVYAELLCAFDPPPTSVMPGTTLDYEQASHSADTAILCTNSQVHCEAYDVMVKTNRFVHIVSTRGLPIRNLLSSLRVPVVSTSKSRIERFQGFVLAVSLSTRNPRQAQDAAAKLLEPCDLMILGRDLPTFCEVLTDGDVHMPGFSENLRLNISVGPAPVTSLPRYRKPYSDFFTEKIQRNLLQPFRTRLRGIKDVHVTGLISRQLSSAAQADIARDEHDDYQKIVDQVAAAKAKGQRLFREKDLPAACLTWQDAALDLERIHQGSSWNVVAERGGEPFLMQVAEHYFLLKLNIAHVQLVGMEHGIPGYPTFDFLVEDALSCAFRSIRKDHWAKDFRWLPSHVHRAKLCYRWALLLRLQDKQTCARKALTWIDKALELQPGDPTILSERARIHDWVVRSG